MFCLDNVGFMYISLHVFLNQLTHTYSDAQTLIILHPSVIASVITISSHGTSYAKYLEIYL